MNQRTATSNQQPANSQQPTATRMPLEERRPKLQAVNYANIAAYVLNTAVTYGIGASGAITDLPTNAELSAKYQTLVTPAGYAFSIWGIIFLSELIWTICQALPAFRCTDLVIKGVGYGYVLVCLAQSAWSLVFALEWIPASLVAMLSILVALVWVVQNLSRDADAAGRRSTTGGWKYWIFCFPFEIHCGWIWAATAVNANVLLVAAGNVASTYQVVAAWTTLAFLLLVAAYYLYWHQVAVYVVPLVLAWAAYAVKVELSNPRESIATNFSAESIDKLAQSALAVNMVLLVTTLVTILMQQWRRSHNNAAALTSDSDPN